MRLYKLTDEHDQTYRRTQWGPDITHSAPGDGLLCTKAWVHAYTDPDLAVLLNPIHANFATPHLWEAEGAIDVSDGVKVGTRRLTTLRRLEVPTYTNEQRVRFAIACAWHVYAAPAWQAWARHWLDHTDRSAHAAEAAVWAATTAAAEAAEAAAWAAEAAVWAATAAARAAEAAANACALPFPFAVCIAFARDLSASEPRLHETAAGE